MPILPINHLYVKTEHKQVFEIASPTDVLASSQTLYSQVQHALIMHVRLQRCYIYLFEETVWQSRLVYAIIVLIIQNYTQDITQTLFRENVFSNNDEKTFNLMQMCDIIKMNL